MTTTIATRVKLSELQKGDVLYEESHYTYEGWNGKTRQLKHLGSGEIINVSDKYVEDLLTSAEQYHKEEEVGKEDKFWTAAQLKKEKNTTNREGDLRQKGIRSIWNDIRSKKVFTVNFNKQGEELSPSKLISAREKQLQEAVEAIERAAANKKGIKNAALAAIKEIQENPIQEVMKGDERTLRGYKTQFDSITGYYNVIDMEKNAQRQVNVNTINWLVVDGVKYIVK